MPPALNQSGQRDQRLTSLIEQQRLAGMTPGEFLSGRGGDPYLTAAIHHPTQAPSIRQGMVVRSHPMMQWCLVQIQGRGQIGCSYMTGGSVGASGVRSAEAPPPGQAVLVHAPDDLPFGYILGSIPQIHSASSHHALPDVITQGSPAGILDTALYLGLFTTTQDGKSSYDFSAGRPADATPLDWTRMAETGVGIMVSPFECFLRVDESCGLFLNYLDRSVRLYGRRGEIQLGGMTQESYEAHERLYGFSGRSLYPWELDGALREGDEDVIRATQSAEDYQKNNGRGVTDLAEGYETVRAYTRWREFHGPAEAGFMRQLVVPSALNYANPDAADPRDVALFEETVYPDGAYVVRSSRSVLLAKRSGGWSVRPKLRVDQLEAPEEATEVKTYLPSDTASPSQNAAEAADGAADRLSSRKKAFTDIPDAFSTELPEEAGLVQSPLDFGRIRSEGQIPISETKPTAISENETVDYVEREAGVHLLPDGGVVIYGGCGEQITMAGGNISISCPGDVTVQSGRNIANLAGQDAITRAYNSVDVSAGRGDVRLKAEHNLQALAGNDKVGGVLIESRGVGQTFDYEGRVGEDASGPGVVIKSENGPAALMGSDVYLRAGVESSLGGSITLDANKGSGSITARAQAAALSLRSSLSVGFANTSGELTKAHVLGSNGLFLDGNASFTGGMSLGENFACGGSGSFKNYLAAGNDPGRMRPRDVTKLEEIIQTSNRIAVDNLEDVSNFLEAALIDLIDAPGGIGSDGVIKSLAFSYRDDPEGRQYGTESLKMVEPRWVTEARLHGATGVGLWQEPVVTYQGQDLTPWPGASAESNPSVARPTGDGEYNFNRGQDETPDSDAIAEGTPRSELASIRDSLYRLL